MPYDGPQEREGAGKGTAIQVIFNTKVGGSEISKMKIVPGILGIGGYTLSATRYGQNGPEKIRKSHSDLNVCWMNAQTSLRSQVLEEQGDENSAEIRRALTQSGFDGAFAIIPDGMDVTEIKEKLESLDFVSEAKVTDIGLE